MTNLDKFKQYFQTLTAQEVANLVYHPDTCCELEPASDNFCCSIPGCLEISCEECFARWLESEAEQEGENGRQE